MNYRMRLLVILCFVLSLYSCGNNGQQSDSDGDIDLEIDLVEDEEQQASEMDTESENEMEQEIIEQETEAEADMEIEADSDTSSKIKPYDCLNDPDCVQLMVAAHRGYTAKHPENSIAALRDAAKLGCQFVEIDVRDTSDDKLVLMHDSSVNRTTDGTGEVSEMSWAELSALTLLESEAGNVESEKIPLFEDVLKVAKEEGVMLYIDQKTDRSDLILKAIEDGEYYENALVRDGVDSLYLIKQKNDKVMLMPPVENESDLDYAIEKLGDIKIVEIAFLGANADFASVILNKGIKIQQDTFAGDIQALTGDYSGWKNYVDAGIRLMQTEMPHLLQPAADIFNQGGEFPQSGPGDLKK